MPTETTETKETGVQSNVVAAEAKIRLKAQIEAREEAKAKAEAEAEEKLQTLTEEAKSLGIKLPRISMAGFKSDKPEDIEKEKNRIAKDLILWLQNMITQAKIEARMKPIDKRREVLRSRFKAIRSHTRANTYSNKNVEAWLEEYNLINNSPGSWNRITANGTKPFTPGNRKKKSAKDILDSMDLED